MMNHQEGYPFHEKRNWTEGSPEREDRVSLESEKFNVEQARKEIEIKLSELKREKAEFEEKYLRFQKLPQSVSNYEAANEEFRIKLKNIEERQKKLIDEIVKLVFKKEGLPESDW